MNSETIVLDDKEYIIQYQLTKVGDILYDKDSDTAHVASQQDIGDMNWVLTDQINYSNIEQ